MRIGRVKAVSSPLTLSTDAETGKKLIKIPLLRRAVFQKGKYGRLVFDDPFMKKLAENFNKNVVGHDIAIDLSHKPEDGAYGWVRRVEYDGNRFVIYAEPTPEGLATVESGKYRYASADISLNHEDRETGAAFGPTLLGAALTNRPYVHGQEPISVVTLSATERARMSVRKGIARVSFETHGDVEYRVVLAYPRSKGFKPISSGFKKIGTSTTKRRNTTSTSKRGYRPIVPVTKSLQRQPKPTTPRRTFSYEGSLELARTWGGKPAFKGFSRKSRITVQGKNVKPSRMDRFNKGKRVAKGVGQAAFIVGSAYAAGSAKRSLVRKYKASKERKRTRKLSIPVYREGDTSVLILAARKTAATGAKKVAKQVASKVKPKKLFPKMKRRHAGALGFAGGALAAAGAAGAGYAAVSAYNNRKRKKA